MAKPDAKRQRKNVEESVLTSNPLTGRPYSKRYFDILSKRKSLPAWEKRKDLGEVL